MYRKSLSRPHALYVGAPPSRVSGSRWDLGFGIGDFRPRRSAAAPGFTLLEILVVIVIIGVLVSLVIVGVTYALRASKISNTEAMIGTIKGTLENYHTRWRDYPPSSLTRYRGIAGMNPYNHGIESLVASLSSKQRGGILYQPPSQDHYINTDDDQLPRNPTGSYLAENGPYVLFEYADFFGNPLLYLHHNDYPQGGGRYKIERGGPDKVFQASRGVGKSWAMPNKFQLVSPGPDGEPGTADDIRGF